MEMLPMIKYADARVLLLAVLVVSLYSHHHCKKNQFTKKCQFSEKTIIYLYSNLKKNSVQTYNPIVLDPSPPKPPPPKVGAVDGVPNPVNPVPAGLLNVLDGPNVPNAEPPAGVNVPNPLKPVVADEVGAPNVDPKPVVGFAPNKPPEK